MDMTDQPSEPITIRRRTHPEQLTRLATRLRDTHQELARALESLGVAAPSHLVVMMASAVQLEVIAQELAAQDRKNQRAPGEAPKCLHCGTYLRRVRTPGNPEGWRHMFGEMACATGGTTATPAPGYTTPAWDAGAEDNPTEDEYDAAHREEREAGENLRAAAIRYAAARHRLDTVLNTPEEQQ
jgi:hypothetical protein